MREFLVDRYSIDADEPELLKIGLSLASVAKLTYEPADVVRETVEDSGLGLVSGFPNPFAERGSQGFVLEAQRRYVLAFRGSDERADWVRNLQAAKILWSPKYRGRVHKGFASALRAVWKPALARLREMASEKPVLFAGHSLGGAMAVLAASRFDASWIHTFGQPLVGGETFCRDLEARFPGKFHRWVNHEDIVARLPPKAAYAHAGILHYLTADGELLDGRVEDPPESVRRPLSREEFKELKEWMEARRRGEEAVAGRRQPPGWADHSLSEGYLPKLRKLVDEKCRW